MKKLLLLLLTALTFFRHCGNTVFEMVTQGDNTFRTQTRFFVSFPVPFLS